MLSNAIVNVLRRSAILSMQLRRSIKFAFLMLAVVAGSINTASATEGWAGTATVGPIVIPKYVGGKATQTLPIPLLSINYDETFYVEVQRVGVYVLASDDKKLGLGIAAEPRFGFSAKDGARLAGLAKRRDSIEGGPTFDWDFDVVAVSLAYFSDLTNASRSTSTRASAYMPLFKGDRGEVGVIASADSMSAKTANYYFGVAPNEALTQRPLYLPGRSLTTTLGFSGTYKITKSNALMFGLFNTRLPSRLASSPIVETARAPSVFLGYGWTL
jgi:outer membrane protein